MTVLTVGVVAVVVTAGAAAPAVGAAATAGASSGVIVTAAAGAGATGATVAGSAGAGAAIGAVTGAAVGGTAATAGTGAVVGAGTETIIFYLYKTFAFSINLNIYRRCSCRFFIKRWFGCNYSRNSFRTYRMAGSRN